ncbi:hypothetical protein [Flavivirga jejuensis]|uniref:Uncharacterized protein n=1 Tax=Flavivirga jejuensis TaxID=870487 RepID=A0ABT8WTT0_9FLAO|nr:hypothetical protein [Flavivirga jejuensis]MDO5976272.1 hypothetical protein [Flavivirga jejuensis]
MITKKALQNIGMRGTKIDMVLVLPNGKGSELHVGKEMPGEDWNISFTSGNTNGVPGKDYDYVEVGTSKSIEQIKLLINLLKNMYNE